MIVIPAIDILDNEIVRLTRGNFDNITYYRNTPFQQAQLYESHGFGIVHIVDLKGAKTGKFTALEIAKRIKTETKLKVEFGGGIRDVKTATKLISSGIDYIIIGSLSVKNKKEFELIVKNNSPERIVNAIDVENEEVKITGWTEKTSVSIYTHIEYCLSLGVKKVLCTDISKDGMLIGLNMDLYQNILMRFPEIELIASGGVRNIEDVINLKQTNIYGVVIGKAIYEDKIDLKELARIAL
ncbi:MAG: 1-(5-phosphoribosyl)-5-[(5-phosphoribosylamino)methylideneamino]imidazole-4-carboxamide isomerase [Ignavibacteriaceae bacterium]